jgi:hypothetical protein
MPHVKACANKCNLITLGGVNKVVFNSIDLCDRPEMNKIKLASFHEHISRIVNL